MPETLSYTYTTRAEMARLFSEVAVQLREDDDDDGVAETSVIQDCIDEATDTINTYLQDWHEASAMAENISVRRWATLIACWLLSQRRGNPEQFAERYAEIIGRLERMQKGELRVPRLLMRKDVTPGVTNYHVDDRFQIKKLRVEETITTGGPVTQRDPSTHLYDNETVWP